MDLIVEFSTLKENYLKLVKHFDESQSKNEELLKNNQALAKELAEMKKILDQVRHPLGGYRHHDDYSKGNGGRF